MSSPCRCAAAIIARSIAVAMKSDGGGRLGLIRRHRPCAVVGNASAASNFGHNGRHGSPAALGTDQKNGKGDPPVSKLASNSTTKAIPRFDKTRVRSMH
jgi:hypothetical protein